jgi:DNA-binding NtrC family response regulator
MRVGSSELRRVDVRVIAASNRVLDRELREGRFRADLFYRLNVVELRIPALRERREDIPLLVRHFASGFARRFGRDMMAIDHEPLTFPRSTGVSSHVRPIADLEREEILRALAETGGNKKEAARRLGLSRRALYRRLEKFGLDALRHAAA